MCACKLYGNWWCILLIDKWPILCITREWSRGEREKTTGFASRIATRMGFESTTQPLLFGIRGIGVLGTLGSSLASNCQQNGKHPRHVWTQFSRAIHIWPASRRLYTYPTTHYSQLEAGIMKSFGEPGSFMFHGITAGHGSRKLIIHQVTGATQLCVMT
jgi:hypothetical protein